MVKKIILRTLIFFGSILIIYIGFLYFSYFDESINEGKGYGFKIGIPKKEAYEVIIKKYGEDFIRYRVYQEKKVVNEHSFDLRRISYDDLSKYSGWKFYFHEIASDFILLEFERDKLVAIHRHRQYYELP